VVDDAAVPWPTCTQVEGCNGASIAAAGGCCLGHLEESKLELELDRVKSLKVRLDARGVHIGEQLLSRILSAIRRAQTDYVKDAMFNKATFLQESDFSDLTEERAASFEGAVFEDEANFEGIDFGADANFERATFRKGAKFDHAIFGSKAFFENATFCAGVSFGQGTSFGARASFDHATVSGDANFEGARFGDETTFYDTSVGSEANFSGATFGKGVILGPLSAKRLILDRAFIPQPKRIELQAQLLSCVRVELPDGGIISLESPQISFSETSFSQPTIISPRRERPTDDPPMKVSAPGKDHPRLLSLSRANVENLVLTDVDLSSCRFRGVHNLDKVRLEGATSFALAPKRPGRGRQVLADEPKFRPRWKPKMKVVDWPFAKSPLDEREPADLSSSEIAALYRSLRKAREDAKDEPGAADFYFGEMEMRLEATTSRKVEHWIIWIYRLVSGYGLRATRALAALVLLLALSSILFYAKGFSGPAGFNMDASQSAGSSSSEPTSGGQKLFSSSRLVRFAHSLLPIWEGVSRKDSWLFSVEAALNISAQTETKLTPAGRFYRAILRVFGPLLIGLAALSVRGRIKR
jgi:uncharacterized protein YjbI with pentapeptide repeats